MVSKEELRKLDKEQLVNLVSDLLIKSDALASLVHHLQDEINKLKTHKNSGNSSLPPSHDLFSIRNQSLRGKSDKKSGGQPGHKGETLRMSPEIGRAMRTGASADQLRELAIAQGMVPMAADGVARVALGETTLSELRRLFVWQ